MSEQEQVNALAARIRREVIYYLLKREFLNHRQSIPEKEQLAYEIEEIAKMPCETKLLKRLFDETNEMRSERGFFPAVPSVQDLRDALRFKSVGYKCTQRVPYAFLPHREDKELRALPSCKALLEIYRKQLSNGQKILLPMKIGIDIAKDGEETTVITKMVCEHIKTESHIDNKTIRQ